MAPGRLLESEEPWTSPARQLEPYDGPPRNLAYIEAVKFDANLQPKKYEIAGTHPDSRILFTDVKILEASGKLPYAGDVLIEGEKIVAVGEVPNKAALQKDPKVRVFHGRGRTLMPGLGDAHTHFTWNGGDLARLGELGVEEHVLLTARSAQCYIDSGYTMCFGAASAKDRLDVVIRDAINAGDLPGPRYLANGKEIARRDGDLVAGITAYADGPDEMREVINHHVNIGVDQIKLSMSGEEHIQQHGFQVKTASLSTLTTQPYTAQVPTSLPSYPHGHLPFIVQNENADWSKITEIRSAQDCYFEDKETAACVEEAHKLGRRLCAHARARDSVKQCVRHGVDVIYHASYIDEEGMDMLEAKKDKHIVAPGLNWLIATLQDAAAFGYTHEKAEQVGYKKELEHAIRGLREMHRRGIVVLPGGDYGFAWTPHGTYARDLAHFKNLLGFTAHESIIAATFGVAKLFMRSEELGKIAPGYYADCILVDGEPLERIEVLQEHDKLNVIVINGRVHKAGRKEYIAPPVAGQDHNSHVIVPDFPEVKKEMQKNY